MFSPTFLLSYIKKQIFSLDKLRQASIEELDKLGFT